MRSLGGSSWLATVDGATVVARAVEAPPSDAWTDLAHGATSRCATLVPILGWAIQDGRSLLLSKHIRAVSMDRLLSAVTLTPCQAGYLGQELLSAVGQLHEAGLAHTRLSATSVLVDAAGTVHIADWAVRQASCDADTSAADAAAVRLLLRDITRNAAGPPHRARGHDALLLSLLERCASQADQELPAQAAAIDAVLVAVGDAGAAQAQAGLRAVVATLSRDSPTAVHRGPAGVAPTRGGARPSPRVRRAAAIAAAAAVVLGAGGYVAAHRIAAPRAPAAQHEAAAVPGAMAVPRPLPSLPAAGGAVRGLDVRPLTPCASGGSCDLRVAVQVSPSAEAQQLDWSVRVVDRCGAATDRLTSGAMPVRAGRSYAYTTMRVQLPASSSLAVIASAGSPARAASPPLLVPVGGGRC